MSCYICNRVLLPLRFWPLQTRSINQALGELDSHIILNRTILSRLKRFQPWTGTFLYFFYIKIYSQTIYKHVHMIPKEILAATLCMFMIMKSLLSLEFWESVAARLLCADVTPMTQRTCHSFIHWRHTFQPVFEISIAPTLANRLWIFVYIKCQCVQRCN